MSIFQYLWFPTVFQWKLVIMLAMLVGSGAMFYYVTEKARGVHPRWFYAGAVVYIFGSFILLVVIPN